MFNITGLGLVGDSGQLAGSQSRPGDEINAAVIRTVRRKGKGRVFNEKKIKKVMIFRGYRQ